MRRSGLAFALLVACGGRSTQSPFWCFPPNMLGVGGCYRTADACRHDAQILGGECAPGDEAWCMEAASGEYCYPTSDECAGSVQSAAERGESVVRGCEHIGGVVASEPEPPADEWFCYDLTPVESYCYRSAMACGELDCYRPDEVWCFDYIDDEGATTDSCSSSHADCDYKEKSWARTGTTIAARCAQVR